jgi:hypothetical protein
MDPVIILCPLSTMRTNPIIAQQITLGANISQVSMYKLFLPSPPLLPIKLQRLPSTRNSIHFLISLIEWTDPVQYSLVHYARCAQHKQKKQATLFPFVYIPCVREENVV